MKQRITVEQLQELTEEQQQRLREWYKPDWGDHYFDIRRNVVSYFDHEDYDMFNPKKDLPLLSIGQMIELLEEKKMVTESLDIKAPKGLINIYSVWYGNGDFPKKYESEELCDALWQAVKQML